VAWVSFIQPREDEEHGHYWHIIHHGKIYQVLFFSLGIFQWLSQGEGAIASTEIRKMKKIFLLVLSL
jgi:hypothetical protein